METFPYRLRYKKNEPYISQIDLLNVFKRAFRRAKLPLAYSEGFNPQPILSFGPALPLGFTGSNEVMDFRLASVMDTQEILEKISRSLPNAVTPLKIKSIEKHVRPINRTVEKAVYIYIAPFKITEQVVTNIKELMGNSEVMVTHVTPKKIRTRDFKPFLIDIIVSNMEKNEITFILRMMSGNLPNPSPLLPLIFKEKWSPANNEIIHFERTEIFLDESEAKVSKKQLATKSSANKHSANKKSSNSQVAKVCSEGDNND